MQKNIHGEVSLHLKIFKSMAIFVAMSSTIMFSTNLAHADTTTTIAPSTSDFDVLPINPKKSGIFYEDVKPGQKIEEKLQVANLSDHSITLYLSALDAINDINGGGVTYTNSTESTNKWEAGLEPQITLSAKEKAILPFSIQVPTDARSGDYIFGLIAREDKNYNISTGDNNNKQVVFNEDVNYRKAISAQIHVEGSATSGVSVSKAEFVTQPTGGYLYVYGNCIGMTYEKGVKGRIEVSKDNGNPKIFNFPDMKFVPNSPFQFQIPWGSGNPELGNYTVKVVMDSKNFGHYEKVLTFALKTDDLKTYQDLTGTKALQAYVPNWVYFVGGGILITVFLLIILLFRQKKKLNTVSKTQSIVMAETAVTKE